MPFVTGEPDPAIRRVLVEEAAARGARPIVPVDTRRPPSPGARLGLKGPHQWQNAWVALAALNALPKPFGPVGADLPASFADASVPGRFDVRGGGRWIFDVAHNPDGMEVLVATLREEHPARPLHALVGIRNDKEWRPMLERLLPEVDRLVLTVAPTVPVPVSTECTAVSVVVILYVSTPALSTWKWKKSLSSAEQNFAVTV